MKTTTQIVQGERFHRMVVLGFDRVIGTNRYYLCKCDCGTEKVVNGSELRRGNVKSCGCLRREHMARAAKPRPVRNLEGQKFGRLTAMSIDHSVKGFVYWKCLCECGKEIVIHGTRLTTGNTKSCGCLNRDRLLERSTIHGHTSKGKWSREYRIWMCMRNRCERPEVINYKYYGGRGIKVCERWQSFVNFLADMGPIPAPLSIDRIDNDGDYEPGNCRLSTPKEQCANRRKQGTT